MQMLKKRNNKIYQNLLRGMVIAIIINSCKENECTQKLRDERTLNEYFVEIDTCDQFEGAYFYQYFNNDGLFMAGYGDRLLKQGEWSYYYKNEELGKGQFKDGKPIGNWEFKYDEEIIWKSITVKENGFEVSVPSSWFLENDRPNFSLFISMNLNNPEMANFNVIVSDYDMKVSEYINDHTDTLKLNPHIKEIDIKKLKISDIDESFQRKFKVEQNQNEELIFQTFYGKKSLNKVFIITINSKYESYRKYEPIFEVMLNSFKIYEN